MPENEERPDHFGGKTDEEFIQEEREFRRRSGRNLLQRWRLHPLNPASDAGVRVYRGLAMMIALVLMVIFAVQVTRGREPGGFAIATASCAVAFSIAVGARSR